MPSRSRIIIGLFVLVALLALVRTHHSPRLDGSEALCAGPRLRNVGARQEAMEQGYVINQQYDCIDRQSFAQVEAQRDAWQRAHQDAPAAKADAPPLGDGASLGQARRGVSTRFSERGGTPHPLPNPPATSFIRTDYASTPPLVLAAYITPDPRDGRKHPAIVWLTGGDTNTLDDFWTPGPESNDQSASAFRNAGVVMMFPTLRGGNTNAGGREYFFGEIDDVLAAADHLARQSYVDASQIYLGGHSTGGTLALLTAETSGRFRAVFAFGPVSKVDRYPATLVPVQFGERDDPERRLRSPIHWLDGISSPTYLIEGRNPPGNIDDVEDMCARSRNPRMHCILADGSDHFSVLARVSRVVAARISVANEIEFTLRPEEFAKVGRRD